MGANSSSSGKWPTDVKSHVDPDPVVQAMVDSDLRLFTAYDVAKKRKDQKHAEADTDEAIARERALKDHCGHSINLLVKAITEAETIVDYEQRMDAVNKYHKLLMFDMHRCVRPKHPDFKF